ncbi:3-methyladenine DNA glycosylase [Georgenia sp. Z1344]|uniref:3-methyladenine DNA glycosylase n=1 Tax=Georgenia sp. Z1344 TaxID=3416706 RepID=UPI003CF67ABF
MRLTARNWRARAAEHAARADAFTAGHRARRSRHEKHAVEDFLYEYYPFKPGKARRWHPGVGVELLPDDDAHPADAHPAGEGAESVADLDERSAWRWHRRTEDGGVTLDVPAFVADRGDGVRWVDQLLRRTAGRAPTLGCFGWHEWAMVYRQERHRHPLPLRLGQAATDAAVESATIRCSHFDAYRFFTPDAEPLNTLTPTRERQIELDQPGCLHVNMDLLRWCLTLGPAVPGELLLDCADLALDVRRLDMAAAPYDVSGYGLAPVRIEEPAGRAEYARRQKEMAVRAAPLRERLIEVTSALLADE